MSYDLRVWEQPAGEAVLDSFEAAVRIWSKLEGLAPGPNPKFAALAKGMVELDEDGDSPWVGDPIAGAENCSNAVWAFELPFEDRVDVLYAVVKLANAIGLTVFDDQLGLVFCPPDRVLPPERAEAWKGAAKELASRGLRKAPRKSWTLASVGKEIRSSLAALLVPRGFVAEKQPPKLPYYFSKTIAAYSRPTAAGGQSVTLLGRTMDHVPWIVIDVNVFSEAIADIIRALFPGNGEMHARRQLNFRSGLFHGASFDEPVRSPEEVQRLLKAVEDPVLRILEMTRTSPGMESVMAGAVGFPFLHTAHPQAPRTLAEYLHQNYGYAGLISAWLHGNDQFDALRQKKRESERRNAPPALTEVMAQRVDQVTAYLREHVERGLSLPAESDAGRGRPGDGPPRLEP